MKGAREHLDFQLVQRFYLFIYFFITVDVQPPLILCDLEVNVKVYPLIVLMTLESMMIIPLVAIMRLKSMTIIGKQNQGRI